MDLGIKGRRALITGGAGTMGQATAEALLEDGVELVLTDIDEDELAGVKKALGGEPQTYAADLSSAAGTNELKSKVGEIDILVHAAGVTGAKGDPLEMEEDEWNHAWQTDFMSTVRVTKAFMPGMVDKGWGRVVGVTSENAAQSYPDEVVYNVSKVGTLSYLKALSQVYGPKGVMINSVSPAFIKTNMTDGMMEKRADEKDMSVEQAVETFLEEERPYLVLKRRGRAEEAAAVIAFLCSEKASFVLGSNYRVDGGAVIGLDL